MQHGRWEEWLPAGTYGEGVMGRTAREEKQSLEVACGLEHLEGWDTVVVGGLMEVRTGRAQGSLFDQSHVVSSDLAVVWTHSLRGY